MKTATSWLVTTLLFATLVVGISLLSSPVVLSLVQILIGIYLLFNWLRCVEACRLPAAPSPICIAVFKNDTAALLTVYTSAACLLASISMVTLANVGLTRFAATILLALVTTLAVGARVAFKRKAQVDNITAVA